MNVGMMATYDISRAAIVKINGDNFSSQVRSVLWWHITCDRCEAPPPESLACARNSRPTSLCSSAQLMASAISAGACVLTSLPFDMIKTRLQNMKPGPDGTMPYRGVIDCAANIFKVEGPLAFYTGIEFAASVKAKSCPTTSLLIVGMSLRRVACPLSSCRYPSLLWPHGTACHDYPNFDGLL